MKRFFVLLLTFIILFSFTACSNNDDNSSGTETNMSDVIDNSSSESDDISTSIPSKTPESSQPDSETSSVDSSANSSTDSIVSSFSQDDGAENDLPPESSNEQEPDINTMRKNYALGNCQALKDKPVVMLFFIDDNESFWDEASVIDFTENQIKIGLDYLEKVAQNRGIFLDFEIVINSAAHTGVEFKYEGKVETNIGANPSTKDVLDNAAQDLGYVDNWDMHKKLSEKYQNREIIYLTFFNKNGVSYTRHQIKAGDIQYAEHSIIFADYLTAPANSRDIGTRASVVAHELLHLYGAEDFYTTNMREKIANAIYPNDIMLWQFEKIDNNTIGEVTAFSIGWTDTVPEVCYNENWWK